MEFFYKFSKRRRVIFKTNFENFGRVWLAESILSLSQREGEKFCDDNRFGDRDGTCLRLINCVLDLAQIVKIMFYEMSSFIFWYHVNLGALGLNPADMDCM